MTTDFLFRDILGSVAAFLTTISFLPQAVKVLRTRKTNDLSLGMYGCFTVGVALWLAYGLMLKEWPIIIANAVTLSLAATILGLKLRHG